MKKAYSSIELLVSCIIISLALSLALLLQQTIQKQMQHNHFEERIGLYQLRDILVKSHIKKNDKTQITLNYEKEEVTISFLHHRLVKQPGYHILLQNIDKEFNVKGACLYIGDKKIYCEERLYSAL